MIDVDELERCAQILEESRDYRVLRRLPIPDPDIGACPLPGERIAIILDTETTGLDLVNDEVIELGMVAFAYGENGVVGRVVQTFNGLREPSIPITPDITAITGITDEMVHGKTLNIEYIDAFIEPAALIIAHNAAFDRPFCERLSASFRHKPWACSATEVPWRDLGYDGAKLSYLLYQSGFFHDGHRALDDSAALLKVLSTEISKGTYPLQHLLESARLPRFIVEFHAPYELRDSLRKRGYRWRGQTSNKDGHWFQELKDAALSLEMEFLRSQPQIAMENVKVERVTAFDRFRG